MTNIVNNRGSGVRS